MKARSTRRETCKRAEVEIHHILSLAFWNAVVLLLSSTTPARFRRIGLGAPIRVGVGKGIQWRTHVRQVHLILLCFLNSFACGQWQLLFSKTSRESGDERRRATCNGIFDLYHCECVYKERRDPCILFCDCAYGVWSSSSVCV